MAHQNEMDQALKEALQDSLPSHHPGHIPDNERIESEDTYFKEWEASLPPMDGVAWDRESAAMHVRMSSANNETVKGK
jgi:hypothetical protein